MVDRTRMKDKMGRPLTQSLFLELGYSEYAVYTLKDEDYIYEGRELPSIKRLFLECEDTTEYEFATKHLLGWKHWERLCANKIIAKYVEEWREEQEIRIASIGTRTMIQLAKEGNQNSAKWLAEKGWVGKKAGRPTKVAKAAQKAFDDELAKEFEGDFKVIEGNFR